MPFGLTHTLISFQGFINKIFAKNLNIFVIVYLDDIFIYLMMTEIVILQPYNRF